MEMQSDKVQDKYLEFINSAHKRVYVVSVNGTAVWTTNHTLYKNICVLENQKRAQTVEAQGEGAFYEINAYERIHVKEHIKAYSSLKQHASCAILYKEGQAQNFGEHEHVTLVMSNTIEQQEEYVQPIVDSHCEHYDINLNRGHADTQTPYISITGVYQNNDMKPFVAETRQELKSINSQLTAVGLGEWFQPVVDVVQ